jgi:hypothetical protein
MTSEAFGGSFLFASLFASELVTSDAFFAQPPRPRVASAMSAQNVATHGKAKLFGDNARDNTPPGSAAEHSVLNAGPRFVKTVGLDKNQTNTTIM